ncbi:helix-turn-helix domain-containing protein [Tropicimonas sp. IMCC6043]|uniref:helix-turn-helix domain-containing protein n=1 Tax=Tropicimonas sp. IMCC6043 TaxID=2510645 RepID=UPI00101D5D2D|nr:helix-turn-helix domain-containing protein [Tropicimonas sp. IMCC6043]RYH06964.1 helix-turn-helix domain-containing protein [Tropicimonas sp. IMCC6043]
MIGRNEPPKVVEEQAPPKGFDDFDLRLGDVMRGERATLGKSLLDVQRELKIKASFIAAIENADPTAFETPGFVAGYVRSYSRYLGLDPEWAFETFCREANFVSASNSDRSGKPSAAGSNAPVYRKPGAPKADAFDPFASPRISFAPKPSSPLANLEPRAIGSTLVLLALIGAVGYGGWSVLQEIQRVKVTPVDKAPTAIAVVDPLADVRRPDDDAPSEIALADGAPLDSLERIYRPQALDVPVMVARDGPIAALDPRSTGALSTPSGHAVGDPRGVALAAGPAGGPTAATPGATPESASAIDAAVAEALGIAPTPPKVTVDVPEVVLVAVRPAWVRVRSADGSTLFEKVLNPGDTYVVPQTEEPPILRTGAAGALYFAVNGQTYGPAGGNGEVVDKIALNSTALTEKFAAADPTNDADASKAIAVAEAMLNPEPVPGEASPAE